MLSDCHIHTDFSGDCDVPAADQINAAIALGMDEICITDHHDPGTESMSDINFQLDIRSYIPAITMLREKYADKIKINVGIELGLMLHEKDYLESLTMSLTSSGLVDCLIGSCHFVDGYDVYYPEFYEGRSEHDSYMRYFEETLERVREIDCFDVLGHLDFVVRYGPTKNKNYDIKDYEDVLDEIFRILIDRGQALECNTAGFKYGLGEPNPCTAALKRYRELGGELITVGSDAHSPEYVGYEFDRTENILKDCGFRYYTIYHRRKPDMIKLD